MVSLPECFNSPYGTKYFPEYAEPIEGGPTCKALKEAAEKHKVNQSKYLFVHIMPSNNKLCSKVLIHNSDANLTIRFSLLVVPFRSDRLLMVKKNFITHQLYGHLKEI